MSRCEDPCDECSPRLEKIKCSIPCREKNLSSCGCPKCQKELNCKVVCEKRKDHECSCSHKEKISCKISCEKEKPKKCELCGHLI